MHHTSRDVDHIALIEGEGERIWSDLTVRIAYLLGPSGQFPPLLFDFPMLRSDNLHDERVVIVPMREQTLPMRRSQIEVRLETVPEMLLQQTAKRTQFWLAAMLLLEKERHA